MLRWARAGLIFFGLFTAFISHAADVSQISIDRSSGSRLTLQAEIADEPSERSQGLMFREDFGPGDAMLFVYDRPQQLIFWMKNTPRSLDIIYFDSDGYFINVHEATTPFSLQSLRSHRAAQFALEVSAGEAAKLGIGQGSRLVLPFDAN